MEPNYLDFLRDVKDHILQSRYRAARLVNRELLLLYFAVGKRLSEKIAAEKWGAKVLEQISADLQKELPGLRGFSRRSMMKMTQFADVYASVPFVPLTTVQMQDLDSQDNAIMPSATAQFDSLDFSVFLNLGFTHHMLLLNRCSDWNERWFYMQKAVNSQWTVEMLDWQIKAKLYQKQGKLPNNFADSVPESIRDIALQAFKDEYLLDFINVEADDERVVEKGIVQNIREFILKWERDFRLSAISIG